MGTTKAVKSSGRATPKKQESLCTALKTLPRAYVGVDPGSKGAIAFIYTGKPRKIVIEDMPSEIEALRILKHSTLERDEDYKVAMELVHPLPGQSCIASFTYGENNMLAKLLVMCYNSNPVMVSPQRWKNYYGLKRAKGESKTEYKRKSVDKARELFPELTEQLKYSKDGRAEALLIANWLKETYEEGV